MDNKSELLNIIKKSLNKIGYDDEKIIDEYTTKYLQNHIIINRVAK